MPNPAKSPPVRYRLRRRDSFSSPDLLRIVVVDDEEFIVEAIAHMLRARYDVEVQSFTSSLAAWEGLEQSSPDLLIVGGVMPDLCGEEIVRRLMSRNAAYPIVVVSGYLSGAAVLDWFPGSSHISFLQKPFSSAEIFAEIEKHFTITT